MNLQELRWFVAITESENITAVAAEMHVTQPTLSRAISRLEVSVGVKLFDRRQNRLHLNRYGEILRAHALRALSEVDTAQRRITTLADPSEGTVSVCFLHSLGEWLVPNLISRFRDEHPKVRFELRGAAADSVIDDVRAGRSDLGFVAPEPPVHDLVWTPVAAEPVRLLVPAGHRLARRKSVGFAEVAEDDFVALTPEYGLRQLSDRLARAAGFTPRIAFSVTEVGTMSAMVAAGVGVAVVPAPPAAAGAPEGTVLVDLRDRDAWRSIGVIRADRHFTSMAAEGFHRFVLDTLEPRNPTS
ncbi:LysR family transcriptional regulator [Rhodococcus sp. T2V]|uniref:LysR family transcriptional regulator n=1 Tax=Rhodococcus sp. T2V TaxID=3034164 RepID=UPI0023E0D457|nr:LysR family transcriptional regulator [Rhodococcus sp. T2V]MDF3308147.1 LysR family transcriptional regulator [Rhodococcus sp. T2V]